MEGKSACDNGRKTVVEGLMKFRASSGKEKGFYEHIYKRSKAYKEWHLYTAGNSGSQ